MLSRRAMPPHHNTKPTVSLVVSIRIALGGSGEISREGGGAYGAKLTGNDRLFFLGATNLRCRSFVAPFFGGLVP